MRRGTKTMNRNSIQMISETSRVVTWAIGLELILTWKMKVMEIFKP